jgi:hypothetical protein
MVSHNIGLNIGFFLKGSKEIWVPNPILFFLKKFLALRREDSYLM